MNFLEVLKENSIIIIFIVMYLEALNLTGIPALVIIPTIGYFIGANNYSFVFIFFICIFASVLGAITYYAVSYKFGGFIFDYFYSKFPSLQKTLNKAKTLANKHGAKVCLFGRIIPSVRTFISLVSGIFKIRFIDYLIYSSIGLTIWTIILLSLGYLIYHLK